MRRNQRSKSRQHPAVDQDAAQAAGTRTNMSTEQPFDTDQPLFPGGDGKIDELIKQVNVMEGYGTNLNANHGGNQDQVLTPKKDDTTLRRKSNLQSINGRNSVADYEKQQNLNYNGNGPKKQQTMRQKTMNSDLIRRDQQASSGKKPLLWSGRKQKDVIVKDQQINGGDHKPLISGRTANKVQPPINGNSHRIQDQEVTIEMESLELGLNQTREPDEFGQVPSQMKNIEDFGRLRSYLNSVSSYSNSKYCQSASELYEGQGSQDNQKSSKNLNTSDKDCVEIEKVKPVFRQLMKRGFYKFEYECIQTYTESQDTVALDIDELKLELEPKICDIKDQTKYLTFDPDQKKEQKKPRKTYQLLKELIEQKKQLAEHEMMEFDEKEKESKDKMESPSQSRSAKRSNSEMSEQSESQSKSDRSASGSDESEEDSDSLTSDSDSNDASVVQRERELEEEKQRIMEQRRQEELEEMKNMIRIVQTVKVVKGKYLKTKTVWDLGQQKMIGEPVESEALDDERKIGEYDMRLDKETYNFFKNQEKLVQQYKDKKNKKNKKKDNQQLDQNWKEQLQEHCMNLWIAIKNFTIEFYSRMRDKNYIFMVSQNDPRKTYWELFVIVLALYNAFSIPFELSFEPKEMEGTNFLIINSIIDLLFAFDIFVQFRTTFYHPITGDEVKDLKVIKANYLRGRFVIDFLSTVPFDNILFIFTQTENPVFAMFSLLKIIRVTRLGRIIARLNVSEDTKNSLKLFQLVFFIIMYIHCSGCAWFAIVAQDESWIAPLDIGSEDEFLYDDSTLRKYFMSIYHSVLLMTGNDAFPVGDIQVFFVVFSNTVGAIINANILGNMAVLIQDLNRKQDAFQKKLDQVNTAMQNIKLPLDLQSRIVGFLQFTQKSQENQKELTLFIQNISPSLKHQVIEFIFQNVIENNSMFQNDKQLVNILFSKMELLMYDPEEVIIRQGQLAQHLYFISKGECEVKVADEDREDTFVQILCPGTYFGEIALISSQNRRTATIQTKNYSNIGHITRETFNEIVTIFPEVKNSMKQNLIKYQDKYRCWQKFLLLNIDYFRDLSLETYEEIIFHFQSEVFQAGYQIFQQNKYYNKVYILVNGQVEMFFALKNKDLKIETLKDRGCVMNQVNCLTMDKITYSARAIDSVTLLTISLQDIQDIMLRRKDLRKRIDRVTKMQTESEMNVMIDYTRNTFFQRDLKKKELENQKDQEEHQYYGYGRSKEPSAMATALLDGIQRLITFQTFNRQKEGKIQELLRQLRRQNSGVIKNEARKTEKVIEEQTPIMKQKIQSLVIKQINQLQQSAESQQERLSNISELIREIQSYKDQSGKSGSYKQKKDKQKKKKK